MKRCGKKRGVLLSIRVPCKVGDLGIGKMMSSNMLEAAYPQLVVLYKLENGDVTDVANHREVWAVWKKMEVKDGGLIHHLLDKSPRCKDQKAAKSPKWVTIYTSS